ncbi:hypothetical protein F441_15537 [Phytophthora nicotianae CJ01A1]|uniref:Uncharacterized protein n=2 Tax=Phytophthora nicotianae TaxID=4792 RepID=W2WDV4_PHYNI|nr:hypothetical protein L916_15150 [Phytophthora nicotianae]ETP08552.1 hypothetical protein F441_15537 [Phytophthora nicotianae CJ01A1]
MYCVRMAFLCPVCNVYSLSWYMRRVSSFCGRLSLTATTTDRPLGPDTLTPQDVSFLAGLYWKILRQKAAPGGWRKEPLNQSDAKGVVMFVEVQMAMRKLT